MITVIDRNNADQNWAKVFASHPTLDEIHIEKTDNFEDLTVYYNDSDDPFPITSLEESSALSIDLYNAWEIHDPQNATEELIETV